MQLLSPHYHLPPLLCTKTKTVFKNLVFLTLATTYLHRIPVVTTKRLPSVRQIGRYTLSLEWIEPRNNSVVTLCNELHNLLAWEALTTNVEAMQY